MDLDTYCTNMTSRCEGLFTQDELQRISEATICGAGAGGVGGWTYLTLARLGVQYFKIAEPGEFDAADANRQAGCSYETLGKNKAEVLAAELKAINPKAHVDVFTEGVQEANMSTFLEDGTIAVDGIDLFQLQIKRDFYDAAKSRGMPVITSPLMMIGAALAIFNPDKSPSFEKFFGKIPHPDNEEAYRKFREGIGLSLIGCKPKVDFAAYMPRVHAGSVPSTAPSVMQAATLASLAIVDQILEKNDFPLVPVTLHVDLLRQRLIRVKPWRRWFIRTLMGKFLKNVQKKNNNVSVS